MKKFTVIGVYQHSGQIFAWRVEAENSMHAFAVAGAEIMDSGAAEVSFIVCIEGHCFEQTGFLTFPGESLVDSQTVRDQPEVFGESGMKYFEVTGYGHYDEEPEEESRVLWVKASSRESVEDFLVGRDAKITQEIPPCTVDEGLDFDLTKPSVRDGAAFSGKLIHFQRNPVPRWKVDQWLSAEDLDNKYNPEGDGEHPTFSRSHWREAVSIESTVQGYWQWCKHMIELKAEGIDS